MLLAIPFLACSPPTDVVFRGDGRGEVRNEGGDRCTTNCALRGPISAFADEHSVFSGWDGACSGTGKCRATGQVGARFVAAEFPIHITVDGKGSVLPDASQNSVTLVWVRRGQTAVFRAVASSGWVFDHWGGCDTESGEQCRLGVEGPRDITAHFVPAVFLGVSAMGPGAIEAQGQAPCSSVCNWQFKSGERVVVNATPAAGAVFDGWGGACAGSSCELELRASSAVSATFFPAVNVSAEGDGSASIVAPSPCTAPCAFAFRGEPLQIQFRPDANSRITSIRGCASASATECVVTGPGLVTVVTERIITQLDPIVGTDVLVASVTRGRDELAWLEHRGPLSFRDAGVQGDMVERSLSLLRVPGSGEPPYFPIHLRSTPGGVQASSRQNGGQVFAIGAARAFTLGGVSYVPNNDDVFVAVARRRLTRVGSPDLRPTG